MVRRAATAEFQTRARFQSASQDFALAAAIRGFRDGRQVTQSSLRFLFVDATDRDARVNDRPQLRSSHLLHTEIVQLLSWPIQ